jgi:hypothetical protein
MPLAADTAVIWVNLVGFGVGLVAGFLVGYAHALRRAHAYAPMHRRRERELFTTTTPDRYPPGRVVTIQEGRHVVTQVADLGSFYTIDGQSHRHWRVYGRLT